jgi:glutathione S-transferase
LIGGREFIAGNSLTLADILLYCTMDFGATVGQPINRDFKNIAAWFDRVNARLSAEASRK